MNVEANQLFIFDLDGTLYEGTDHFDYYASKLKKLVSDPYQTDFYAEYEKMKAGHHVVSIGKGYDIKHDCIFSIDPLTLQVTKVEEWDGICWEQEKIQEMYPNPIVFDFTSLIAIGDGWWLPFVCATHYGVKDCYSSYLATKEYMVSDQFNLEKIPGLREWLLSLKTTKQIVLMTNSDREDVGRLLRELALDDVFDHIISSAKKPSFTKGLFQELLQQYKLEAHEAVSIGDNFINEIAPALTLGMNGVYIHSSMKEQEHSNLTVIPSIREIYNSRI
ncbi:HAD family hydrolase [Bacillus alkalicellulosilyticus]|uniref:HAD family hydrolase n=1 Tax=Alkalihalobacterium alkalicellulosilyticum TaxID=1912214 RepID=UPI00099813D0|nr:HAD family hydrolase [Bacillus alkalicellulosilyticus]